MDVAQDWANNCARACQAYHSTVQAHPLDGESIYPTNDYMGPPKHGRDAADCFYKEQKLYRPGMGYTWQTGHFTMMVWKNVKMMGVGMAIDRRGWSYTVVSYSPRGNGGAAGTFEDNVLPLGTPLPRLPTLKVPAVERALPQPADSRISSKKDKDDGSSVSANEAEPMPFVTKPRLAPTNKKFKSYSQVSAAFIVADAFGGTLGDCVGNRLDGGQHLSTNQFLKSSNGKYIAILQDDGNFVLYNRERNGWADWAAGTNSYDTARNENLIVQLRNDGFITVADSRSSDLVNPLWKSSTGKNGGCFLILEDDGNLVAYSSSDSSNPYFSVKQ